MKACSILLACLLMTACVSRVAQSFETPDSAEMGWYKGNTHAHSRISVGDVSPTDVTAWYKDNGYQFLVLTDDTVPSDPALISEFTDTSFNLIAGMEIKSYFGARFVHTNGLNAAIKILPQEADSLLNTLQTDIDAVRAIGGVPQINHPNFRGGPDRDTILKSSNCNLMEIYNGNVGPDAVEKNGYLSTESDWDYILTAGRRMYGLASDDVAAFSNEGYGGKPGRGWVVVRSARLDAEEICRSLDKGSFYASTGVVLKDIVIEPNRIEIFINAEKDITYNTVFVGDSGLKLFSTKSNPAVFELSKRLKYVRAKVTNSQGKVAWIQPVFIH